MKIILTILGVAAPILIISILLMRLREHRTDLKNDASVFEGASRIWQINVMRPSNYSRKGRRLLAYYYVALAALTAGVLNALLVAYRA